MKGIFTKILRILNLNSEFILLPSLHPVTVSLQGQCLWLESPGCKGNSDCGYLPINLLSERIPLNLPVADPTVKGSSA
jgi:hypothetical protein